MPDVPIPSPAGGEDRDPDQVWLDSLAPALLRDEYPDDMAKRSCTCEADAICGAHRLLARYDALYQHMRPLNAERRELRAKLAEAKRLLTERPWDCTNEVLAVIDGVPTPMQARAARIGGGEANG